MKKSSMWFLLGVAAVMLLAGLISYYWGQGEQPAGGPTASGEVPLSEQLKQMGENLTEEQRREALAKMFANQVPPPANDDPAAPPFKQQLVENIAATVQLVEKQIADLTLWKYYERCVAEHGADGFDAKQAHTACVVYYNRALSEHLELFVRMAVAENKLPAYYRLRFYKDDVYAEVNRILKESDNVIERLVALKLIESSPLIDSGTALDMEVYHNLDKYSSPELALIFDTRYDLPRNDPKVVEKLASEAIKVGESIDTANRAATLLGAPENAEKVIQVVDTVTTNGWEKNMSAMPRGLATALATCGDACAPGYERLARDASDRHVATLLYISLLSIQDPSTRRKMAKMVEPMLPSLGSLSEADREHRENVFARLME